MPSERTLTVAVPLSPIVTCVLNEPSSKAMSFGRVRSKTRTSSRLPRKPSPSVRGPSMTATAPATGTRVSAPSTLSTSDPSSSIAPAWCQAATDTASERASTSAPSASFAKARTRTPVPSGTSERP